MKPELSRILYCSVNRIKGDTQVQAHEFRSILMAARAKNKRMQITGALFCSPVHFAQAIEGPQASVEALLEDLQRDTRHHDILILESSAIEERLFPDWTMAYIDPDAAAQVAFPSALKAAFARPATSANIVKELLRSLVCRESEGNA